MPCPRRTLTESDIRQYAAEQCFLAGTGRVGAELEWFVSPDIDHATIAAACAGPLPAGSTLSFEPGGQVELSSATGTLGEVHAALGVDLAEVRRRAATVGGSLTTAGVHPDRDPVRVLTDPRYVAMEAFWRHCGESDPGAGNAMMCTTASIQVNVDAAIGDTHDRDERWRLAHALSPVLAACFANSPVARGAVTGWRSTRLGIWEGLDRTRTAPALRTGRAADDWAAYLLDANVMLIRSPRGFVALDHAFPFARWLAEGHPLGWPTSEDLTYHASTLFPPVRPKGWFELRCMDAIDEPWWPVPIAVTTALLDDPEAADAAAHATGRASWCWCEAPRWSLDYEPLALAATACFTLARGGLARLGAPAGLIRLVEAYQERFVDRGRCPADQVLALL